MSKYIHLINPINTSTYMNIKICENFIPKKELEYTFIK